MRSSAIQSLALVLFLLVGTARIQGQTSAKNTAEKSLPTIFMLGDYENQYEGLVPEYQSLLEASSNDMNAAFGKLVSMMQEMEAFATLSGYDLKGINAWMHFFWQADGTIDHIGFYLKPNSRNVNTEELKSFLSAFAQQYRFPLQASKKYAHYSSFSFPVMVPRPVPDSGKSTAKKNTGHSNNR